jgi:hypothetical protein
MSDAFKDREQGFENKWAHDEELRFKVTARRDKLLGHWAATELGLTGVRADDYAKTVVAADFQGPGEEDVFAKISADFAAAKLAHSDHAIRRKMADLLAVARDQVMAQKGE